MFMSLASDGRRQTYNSRLVQTIFCTTVLVCLQGLRHETIGIDSYNAYRPFFEAVNAGISNIFNFEDAAYGFELGFILFTKLIKTLCDNTQFYIFVCSAISIIPIGYMIYKYADNIPFAFIIFSSFIVYHFGFSGVRQAVAVGITTISFEYVIQKKPIWFAVFVFLASVIHNSAILFLISYPLYHKLRLTPQMLFFVIIGFTLALFFLKPIVFGLTELIFGGEKYMHKAMEDAVPSYNLMILLAGFLFFTFLSKDSRLDPLRPLLLLTVVFQSLGLISTSASRMTYYFIPYLAVAIPITTSSMKIRKILEFVIASFFIFFFFYSNGGGYLDVVPYKFFWE